MYTRVSRHMVKQNDIVQMMYHTRDIIENAVPIVIHDDIYKGTRRDEHSVKIYMLCLEHTRKEQE
ncbi:MAG: hypothetical protein ACLTJ5_05185 [Clostridium sp.]